MNGYCTKIKKRLYRDYIPSDLIIVCCLNPLTGMVVILLCTADLMPLLKYLDAVLTASLKRGNDFKLIWAKAMLYRILFL